jgi:hypothetical protein
VREVAERAAAINFCLSPALASATPAQLDQVIEVLAGQMRYRKAADSAFLVLDLPDYIAKRVGSLMEFVREMLELDGIPDYQEIVRRQFDAYMGAHVEYSAGQLRFLRAVQNVFLQKRRLTMPDLYSAPLTAFGADAAERWFTREQIEEVLELVQWLTV